MLQHFPYMRGCRIIQNYLDWICIPDCICLWVICSFLARDNTVAKTYGFVVVVCSVYLFYCWSSFKLIGTPIHNFEIVLIDWFWFQGLKEQKSKREWRSLEYQYYLLWWYCETGIGGSYAFTTVVLLFHCSHTYVLWSQFQIWQNSYLILSE